MNTYLAIITTVLVLTQIIHLVQNVIQLRRQIKLLETEPNKQALNLHEKLEKAIDIYLEKEVGKK